MTSAKRSAKNPRKPVAGKKKCTGTNGRGGPCGNWAIKGGTVCNSHGGAAPQVRKRALVRAELDHWGLGDSTLDPGETLLRLVSQSAARAEHYSRLLQEAFDAAERLSTAQDGLLDGLFKGDEEARTAQVDQARQDLDRIFLTGGVAALVGNTYGAVKDVGIYVTGEAIRGLAKLEAEERERCADFSTKAVKAGLAERMVKVAEEQGAMLAKLLRAVLNDPDLELTEGQKQVARLALAREMRALSAA